MSGRAEVRSAHFNSLRFAGSVTDSTSQVDVYTALDRSCDMLHFLKNLGRWGRDSDHECRMSAARCPVFSGWNTAEMFAGPLSGLGQLSASVPEGWSGYECRRYLNVPSRPVLAYFSHHIVATADLRKAIS